MDNATLPANVQSTGKKYFSMIGAFTNCIIVGQDTNTTILRKDLLVKH
jgi:hypothetical protein